ncbi:conserved hypothetical protein [Leishmania major strain Friedlin]|uniref:Uncharacterized protein n=1 Tax=Leishmania major TaxID=5664 RepID=E9AD94_LEIMA|nr:conserved hypothetical protein [Leishmania major strain Friedlin]CAG9576720.1 Retinoic_acid_induced_16-like_protein_-_putative [Leishmania major strain Friedlin]CBZ12180.1 conserved hypothetical protein [Leishmania major strain Friedlin]|eukprot:XP_003721923.1 conserved hypothetical protein [Leishmania major strain Friedlin]
MSRPAGMVARRGAAATAHISKGPSRSMQASTGAKSAPAAAASLAPLSTRRLPADHHSPASMMAVIQEQWLQLCEYFQRVQCANTHDERTSLMRELGSVEKALSVILDALLTDRAMLVANHPALNQHSHVFGGSFRSESAPPSPPESSGDMGALGRAETMTTATHIGTSPSASLSSSCLLDGVDGACLALPPCYRFLFADSHSVPIPPPPTDERGAVSKTKDTAAFSNEPPPIGNIFLLMLCQYAKQDEPPGVRSVILDFLARLLQEADLPTDRSAYPAGEQAMSLLQLRPSVLIVPLLDMVRKVSKALDPANAAALHPTTTSTSASASTVAVTETYRWAIDDPRDGTLLQDAGRTQFVIFLSTLAEKMERVPALANFFVVEDGSQERNLLVPLDALLPYLTHDCSTQEWTHRRDTCRFALSAVVSLAKCSDPWIQDVVAKEERVASRTLNAARTTLLTLCKIPENDDGATQLLYLRDVMRFWATLLTMAPSVADTLHLLPLIEKEFVCQTLLPLLQSPDSHVYSAACVVVSNILADLQGSAPLLKVCFAKALLSTTIRKASGRIVPNKQFYEVLVQNPVTAASATRTGGLAVTRGQQEEKAAASLPEHPITSFFTYYILPHLSSNPCLSEEDKESSTLLGFTTTRWSATKATLLLVQTLAEHVPHVFLREVFLMDVTSLSDVQRKQTACALHTADSGGCKSAQSRGSAITPPHLNIHDCFLSSLLSAAATNPKVGLQPDCVGEAVLSRLLRVEANMPVAALRARQRMMSAMKPPCGSSSTAATATADAAKTTEAPAAAAEPANCWFHAGVQTSPFTTALCEMVQHLDSSPYTVSSLVADLVVSIAVMPDLRVLYTLLDSKRGPLVTALCGLRSVLQLHLERKVAETSPIKKNTGGRGPFASTSTAPRPLAVSMPFLYDMLLQHWDLLVDDEAERTKSPVTPNHSSSGSEVSAEALREVIRKHGNVLYACLYSEYLHAYLDAVIGYTALSQNLIYLKMPD